MEIRTSRGGDGGSPVPASSSEDLIAALSTPWGEGGIAVLRLSGAGSVALVDRVFRGRVPLRDTPPWRMRHGHVTTPEGEVLDEVLAVRFAPPKSYTGEESAELHCHGGALPSQACLDLLLSLGARLARPGEFTRRAFVHGRLSLPQAEAVLSVIRARSREALEAAGRSLQGRTGEAFRDLMDRATNLAAHLEAALDYPEEEIPPLDPEALDTGLASLEGEIRALRSRCLGGMLLREGIRVGLVGRPNVGKSSLLNALLREARAIVTPLPGTTRDLVEAVTVHRGIPLRLVDTAGIRSSSDPLEMLGIQRARQVLEEADLRVWVVDAAEPLTEEDRSLAASLRGDRAVLAVRNKTDLPAAVTEEDLRRLLGDGEICSVSAREERGLETLKDRMVGILARGGILEGALSVTRRQMEALDRATEALGEAKRALPGGLDAAAACLGEVRSSLGALTGQDPGEELLDRVFGEFCIGK